MSFHEDRRQIMHLLKDVFIEMRRNDMNPVAVYCVFWEMLTMQEKALKDQYGFSDESLEIMRAEAKQTVDLIQKDIQNNL